MLEELDLKIGESKPGPIVASTPIVTRNGVCHSNPTVHCTGC